MAIIWIMVVVIYTSDDTNNYKMGMSSSKAVAAGFSIAAAGTPTDYPRGWVPRHIYGKSTDDAESSMRLECPTATSAIFQTATNFTIPWILGAKQFSVQGKFSEKRKVKV